VTLQDRSPGYANCPYLKQRQARKSGRRDDPSVAPRD
jgi:hypothetical protein